MLHFLVVNGGIIFLVHSIEGIFRSAENIFWRTLLMKTAAKLPARHFGFLHAFLKVGEELAEEGELIEPNEHQ